jgi:hypothetical protein
MEYVFDILHRLHVDSYVGFYLSTIVVISLLRHFLRR